MKHIDTSSSNLSGMGYFILGELELALGTDTQRAVHVWLTETLAPLNLQADFINRILKSALDAAGRAIRPGGAGHIHLLVLAPHLRETHGKTWGFFRIEKIESAAEENNPRDHSIEFHLYIEG